MYIEELTINEKFLDKHHIDQIYSSFVHYCSLEENRLTAERYKILTKLICNQKYLNENFQESKIIEKFSYIDINGDLTVDFQDFSKYIILNLKFLASDLSKNKKQEKINLPLTDKEIYIFHDIIKDILFPFDIKNPFLLSEKTQNFINSKISNYFLFDYDKYGQLKKKNATEKYEYFTNYFRKIFPKENINTLNILLCNDDWISNFNGVSELNNIIKSIGLLHNHYEVQFFLIEILNFLDVLITSQLLENLLTLFFKYNVESNAKFFTKILKIFRRIYSVFIKVEQIFQVYKENNLKRINMNNDTYESFCSLIIKFENFYITKIIENLNYFQNKANNYYYLNHFFLFGLEYSKRSKDNLIIFFETFNFLEILYANLNYLVNSENYSYRFSTENKESNFSVRFPEEDNDTNQSTVNNSSINRNNIVNESNQRNNKNNFIDINTLVNGKASDPKFLINSNTINANNKNCENFHFYQIRKILLFCIKLTYIILNFKRQNKNKIDSELELSFAKIKYMLEICSGFFYATNDKIIEENFFILKSLLVNEDVNLEFDFLNNSLNKIIDNKNLINLYNMLLKNNLKNAKKPLQINSILNSKYINFLRELIFSEFPDLKKDDINNINNYDKITFEKFNILDIDLFKDIIDIVYILDEKIFEENDINIKISRNNLQIREQIFQDIFTLYFDVFENIFINDEILNNFSMCEKENLFVLNNQMLNIILEIIEILLASENNITVINIIKRNFIDHFNSHINLFLHENKIYKEILKNDVNLDIKNFDLLIVQKILNIYSIIIESDFTQIKLEAFIKFFNFDFVNVLKQVFDYFYNVYNSNLNSKISAKNKSNTNINLKFCWINFYKFYQTIENENFSSFLHQIFFILYYLLLIFDEFIFTLYIKKTNPNYNFDTGYLDYFNLESQSNKSFVIKFSKFNKIKDQFDDKNENMKDFKINRDSSKNIYLNQTEKNINYLNIYKIIENNQNLNVNQITNQSFISKYIIQNYNFLEVYSLCENIFIELDTKIVEIFSENDILNKQNMLSGFYNKSTSACILDKSFINLPGYSKIRKIKLFLQTPEEQYEKKAQILKIENLLNYSFLKLKNQIKILYSGEEYEIYFLSPLKNLKIQINSTEDLISALKEEKQFVQIQQKNFNTRNNISYDLGNNMFSKNNFNIFSKDENKNLKYDNDNIFSLNVNNSNIDSLTNEFLEMHLYLEKSQNELNKEINLTVCPYCLKQHKITNDFYQKFNELNSNYYLMCKNCREYTFLNFVEFVSNIRNYQNLEEEILNVFPKIVKKPNSEVQSINSIDNINKKSNFISNVNPIQINYSDSQNLTRKNINDNNFSKITKNNFNYNSASKIDLNQNRNFNNLNNINPTLNFCGYNANENNLILSTGKNNNNLSSIGGNNISNNTLNFSQGNFPLSNYSSINNNNLLNNLNNSISNVNLPNTVSRNNLNPNDNINNNIYVLNSANRNLNFQNMSKTKGDFELLHKKKDKFPFLSGEGIQDNNILFDENNKKTDIRINKMYNSERNRNIDVLKKFNIVRNIKNVTEFNLEDQK